MPIRARLTLLPAFGLAILALAALPGTSEAQFGKRLKDAVKRTAEDKAIQKATDTESKAIDGALEGGGDEAPATPAATATPADPAATPAAAPAPPKKAGEGAFVSFDFVPGDQVLHYDDFRTI